MKKSISYLCFSMMVLSSYCFAALEPETDYAEIKNQEKGEMLCLSLDTNKTNVLFKACNGQASQLWRFSPFIQGYLKITNQSLATETEEKCLFTSGGNPVKMDSCIGWGYYSMRAWRATPNIDGSYSLKNKYFTDLGKDEVLTANEDTIVMGKQNTANAEKWQYELTLPSPTSPVIGEKQVLVLATHYTGMKPADPKKIRKAVFGDGEDYASLRHYLQLASHQKLQLSGKVLSDIDLGARPSHCDPDQLLSKAKVEAKKRGVDPAEFDYTFVDLSPSPCGWSGLSAMPGNWVLSNAVGYKFWLWTHEFGHSLGFQHPDTLRNCPETQGVVQVGSGCSIGGVDDPSDTMGGGGGRLYPVNYQLYAGWLQEKDIPVIIQAGTYQLAPLWSATGLQGIRIPRKDGSFLVLEYRQPRGFEHWPDDSAFINGVIVRIMKYQGTHIKNTLVDTNPTSHQGMEDAPLRVGKSIYDELSEKLITVERIDRNAATIRIEDNRL